MVNRRFMKLFTLVLGTFALFFSVLGVSQAELIFQGKLQRSLRQITAGEKVRVILRIYDDEFSGRLIFEEAQLFATETISLSFTLGRGDITVSDKSAAPAPERLWVELEIDDQVLSPRINLAASNEPRELTGTDLRLVEAGLRTAGPATLVISDLGISLNGLLDMGTQSIKLGNVERNDWPAGSDSGWTDDGTFVRLTTSTDNVAIGTHTLNSLYKLQVETNTNAPNKAAIFGQANVSPPVTYSGYGVYGQRNSDSTGGAGVFGEAIGGGDGVRGISDALDGCGIYGEHTNSGFAGFFLGKGFFSDKVGIGTRDPEQSLHVSWGNILVKGTNNFQATDDEAMVYLGDEHNYIEGVWGYGVKIGAYGFSGAAMSIHAGNGYVGIGTELPTRKLWVNGDAGGTDSWHNDSDRRLKKNITTIPDALERVKKLRGVNFEWKDTKNHSQGLQMGFIAQEAKEVIPEVVEKKGEYYSMQYAPITALLVEAVKIQATRMKKLEEENNNLRSEIKTIRTALKKLSSGR